MKKFTLIMTAAIVASSAMAEVPAKLPMKSFQEPAPSIFRSNENELLKNGVKAVDRVRMSRADESGIITEAPGYGPTYVVTSEGFQNSWWFGLVYLSQTKPGEILFDGNDAYIKDPVQAFPTDSYVKGEYTGDQITVKLPQTVYAEEYDDEIFKVDACLVKMNYIEEEEDGESYTMLVSEVVPDEENVLIYNVDQNTGKISLAINPPRGEGEYPEYFVALVEHGAEVGSDAWLLYADAYAEYSIFTDKPITMENGEKWQMIAANDERMVDVVIDRDNNKFYLAGWDPDAPANNYIEGEIFDSKVTFKSGQYLGIVEDYNYFLYFMAGEVAPDEESGNYNLLGKADAFVFDYDADNKVLTYNNQNIWMFSSVDKEELSYWNYVVCPVINYVDPEERNASPKDPSVVVYQGYMADWGQDMIAWDIPNINVNNALLPTDKMYYNIYVDGDLFPISPDEYGGVDEYMEDIPYDYTDRWWDIYAFGTTHTLYFYFDGAESFGLQSFYEGENGKTYSSNLITYIVESEEEINEGGAGETTGIQVVGAAQVAQVYYTNLRGQRVANPENGLYVKTVIMTDGSVKSFKVMVRK